ncbi:MAG: hypothetical protein RLZZ192_1053 [Pseudomonadota bacterium]|jgi:hypothetical protein
MMTRLRIFLAAWVSAVVVVFLLLPQSVAAESGRPRVELTCLSFGTGPMLECLVKVQRRDGTTLSNIQMTLGALMPSMPMAHTIRPVKAAPTGNPGEYKAVLELQMPGVWTVEIDLSGTVRDKVARNLQVDECAGSSRCTAAPAVSGGEASKRPQHSEHHSGKH